MVKFPYSLELWSFSLNHACFEALEKLWEFIKKCGSVYEFTEEDLGKAACLVKIAWKAREYGIPWMVETDILDNQKGGYDITTKIFS